MRLLTGPAGSGKTTILLNQFREALRAGGDGIRLLTPTATLAQHLQNEVAREGLVFHRNLIQTLNAFVEESAGGALSAEQPVLYLLVEQAARRLHRPEFARVVDTAGFCAALARTIEELASAGCDTARLAECLPDTPLGAAFLEVYAEVDRELEARGLELRARRLERVAARMEREGTGGIRTVWLDGFHALPDPELRVIGALGRHCEVTMALADGDLTPALRQRLQGMGFREERAPQRRAAPALAVVKAAGIEREAEEIARRILKQAAAGRPFREMGIIVRAAEIYVPVLRSTMERFGIPARFYFGERLDRHAAVRYLGGAVDAMLGGWDHGETLKVLRLAPRFADWNAMDRFDFKVREQTPNAGLGGLKALAEGSEPLLHKIDALGEIEEWRLFALEPKDWAARFRTLRNLFRPARPEPDAERAEMWRSQARALDEFDKALDEAACALGTGRAMPLEDFWRAVKAVLRMKPLRLNDGRRNVVHVLSAPEARQWVLPVVFVCGMVEKQFPRMHPQNVFFPETARVQLNAAGIRVRTAAEFEREERALFDSAITRATMLATLSYPEFSPRGETNLRSLFLEECAAAVEEQTARAVKPLSRDRRGPGGGPREGIRAPELLRILREKTETVSPTRLESYLQCPFQYFGRSVLRLKERPVRPDERLDFLTQGIIVHAVLAQLYERPQDVEALFEEVFERTVEDKQIPPGYHRERLRNAMLDDLRAFANHREAPRGGAQSRTEADFQFVLEEGVEVKGKIDRLDVEPDGRALVIDYKYSGEKNTRDRKDNDDLLQAPLYLLAAERFFGLEPAGMTYIGLKGGVVLAKWKDGDLPAGWREAATARTMAIVAAIRSGRMEVAPKDRDKCRYCDFRDVCRVAGEEAAVAEGA
ncbi:MAG: PD-(D/E)XK nuclease family protein [Bryobacteraceae bacterium]